MGDDLRVPARRTPIDHEELRAALTQAWRELRGEEPPSDAVSILLAQSALETERGKRCMNWNLGGVKAAAGEPHTYYPTTERLARARAEALIAASTPLAPCELATPDDGGTVLEVRISPSHPMCRFRAHSDLAAGARDYLGLLVRRYADALDQAAAGNPALFVAALSARGYFTGKLREYQRAVEGLFDEYRTPCLSSATEVRTALDRFGAVDVRSFQRAARLRADGIVGAKTRAALRARLMTLQND